MVDFNTEAQRHGEGRPMKDSGVAWIGDVPEGWGVVPIRVAFDEVKLKNADGIVDKALRFSMGTIVPKENFDANSDNYVADTILNYTIVEPSDIVLNGLNLNYDFISKRVAIVREKGVITSAYITIRNTKIDTCDTKYYLYLLKSYDSYKVFHNMGEGVRKILNYNILKRQPILLPPLPEQRAIAGYLDGACGKIDGLREKVEKQIAALEEYKKSVITEAVTGKVEVRGVGEGEGVGVGEGDGATFEVRERDPKTMKPSGVAWIGAVPEGWGVGRIKNVADINTGSTPSRSEYETYYSKDSGIPWIKAEDLGGSSSIESTSEYLTDEGALVGRTFDPDCVYVCCIASVGKVGFSHVVASCNQQINALAFNQKYHYKFGFYVMCSAEQEHKIRASGNVVSILNSTVQSNIGVPIPPLPEQRAIAGYLDRKCAAIDGAVAKCKRQLDNLAEYKKSLIYECVTGKREVGV